MSKRRRANNVITENRKARYDYFLTDFLEVGIVLKGTEIKAIRTHGVSLTDAYVSFKNNEAFLENVHIPHYEYGNVFNHEPRRPRKLLMHKREIRRYSAKAQADSYTCVPTSMYFINGRVKLSIALGKGKKHHDKREAIKQRDDERAIRKTLRE